MNFGFRLIVQNSILSAASAGAEKLAANARANRDFQFRSSIHLRALWVSLVVASRRERLAKPSDGISPESASVRNDAGRRPRTPPTH